MTELKAIFQKNKWFINSNDYTVKISIKLQRNFFIIIIYISIYNDNNLNVVSFYFLKPFFQNKILAAITVV